MVSRVNVSWLIYSFLLVCRIIVAPFLLGYIHPDEFFQGGQELFFGCPPTIPWEFEPDNALRSVFPPTMMTWIPLQIYNGLLVIIKRAIGRHEMIVGMGSLSGTEVLVVPRIACSLVSVLIVDWSVWSICNTGDKQNKNTRNGGVPIPVLLLASAWPTILMLSRPFSNSMESYIFAALMTTILTMEASDKCSVNFFFCWKIGIICALGIFTRFTFVFFAAPILLFLLKKMVQIFGIRKGILWRKLGWMAISFVCLSLAVIYSDTVFYSSRRNETHNQDVPSLFDYSSLVLTPFNALAYNSKVSNLKDHGLHPRWTHAVVNMLIMYGPLTLSTYLLVAPKLLSSVGRSFTRDDLNRKAIEQGDILMVSIAVVLFGLGFLSIAPHQEPRFLLPLLIPLVLLGEKPIRRFPTSGICIWVVFNFILILLFGVLHQGGVTKSLLAVGTTTTQVHHEKPISWIYTRTYMPLTFLTRLPHNVLSDAKTCSDYNEQGVCDQISFDAFGTKLDGACQKDNVRIMDLKSASLEKLQEAIETELSCSNQMRVSDSNAFLYLVIPLIEQNDKDHDSTLPVSPIDREGQFQLSNETYKWNHVNSYGPHLTTEDFPPFGGSFTDFYNMLTLNVYNISCAEMI